MSESYRNKILQAKLEFRDLSYTFVLVIEEHEDHLIAVRLPEHTTPNETSSIDSGTSIPYVPEGWAETRGSDPEFRCMLRRTSQGIEDNIQRFYELWDGQPKPYRFG